MQWKTVVFTSVSENARGESQPDYTKSSVGPGVNRENDT